MPSTPSDERDELARLRELANAATVHGPWAVWHDLDHQGFKTVGDAESYQEVLEDGETDECDPVAHVYTDADAEYIAAVSPHTIRRLLDELDRLRHPVGITDAEEIAVAHALRDHYYPMFAGDTVRADSAWRSLARAALEAAQAVRHAADRTDP